MSWVMPRKRIRLRSRIFMPRCCYLLGIDHKRLTVKFQGLDARLTGISGNVIRDILA